MGIKVRLNEFKRDTYEKQTGKLYDPQPVDVNDAGEPIHKDLEFEAWIKQHSEDYDVLRGMCNVIFAPEKGAPPFKDIFDSADPDLVEEGMRFFIAMLNRSLNAQQGSSNVATPKKRRSKGRSKVG